MYFSFTYSAQMGSTEYDCVKGNSTKETKKKAACVALNTLKQDGKLQTVFPDTKVSTIRDAFIFAIYPN